LNAWANYNNSLALQQYLGQQQMYQNGQNIGNALAIIAQHRRQREVVQQREQSESNPVFPHWSGSRKGAIHIRTAAQYEKLPSGTIVLWPDGDCWKKP